MNLANWRGIAGLKGLVATQPPDPLHRAERIVSMQLHIVLPAKVGVVLVALYYLFFSGWFHEELTPHTVALQFLNNFFVAYLGFNILIAGLLTFWRRFPAGIFQWLVFTLGLLDGIFVSGLVFITGGFDSIAFWIFPGMIVLNALSIPLTTPQLVLNILLSLFYLGAGLLEAGLPTPMLMDIPAAALKPKRGTNTHLSEFTTNYTANLFLRTNRWAADLPYNTTLEDKPADPVVQKIFLLWLLATCCYGVQVLAERQRRVMQEERESEVREAQLHSAGRLAAEFAHQIKNPLAIINNAAFSLQRAVKAGRSDISRQIEIIQEEVERSDRIITQIMGYAQLTEGHVEKLDVAQELDRAIDQVFPVDMNSAIQLRRDYARDLPPLLMQRRHLTDILVNLLLNAREALSGPGRVTISVTCQPDDSVEISIQDTGPGIPPDKVEKIFEAYYSTKEKGTGLGLSMVRHNAELYAGKVRVESELGKGARFCLVFPAKTVISQSKNA